MNTFYHTAELGSDITAVNSTCCSASKLLHEKSYIWDFQWQNYGVQLRCKYRISEKLSGGTVICLKDKAKYYV